MPQTIGSGLPREASYDRLVVSADTVVDVLLFTAVLISFLVIIEPAPYEGVVFLTGGALLYAGTSFHRLMAPLIGLLALWAAFAAFAVMPVINDPKALTYFFVTVYLEVSVIIFALLLAEKTAHRLDIVRRAYILAAFIAASLAIIGYFNPHKEMSSIFLLNFRATSTFKDPNVFGPFLILPVLFLIQDFIYRGFRVRSIVAMLVILMALFLSFSRGAWGHCIASAMLMIALMFWTNKNLAFRLRLVRLSILAVIAVAVLVAVLLSLSAVRDMFTERANLVNYYDGGEHGRFGNQLEGFLTIFDHPNGMGPKQFYVLFGADPHNVYLAGLYAYGWGGGLAYIALVIVTLFVGFKGVLVRAPWQPGLIAVYAVFVGEVMEGFIIDTDHWRHYFLLMGCVWGLSIASLRLLSAEPTARTRPA